MDRLVNGGDPVQAGIGIGVELQIQESCGAEPGLAELPSDLEKTECLAPCGIDWSGNVARPSCQSQLEDR